MAEVSYLGTPCGWRRGCKNPCRRNGGGAPPAQRDHATRGTGFRKLSPKEGQRVRPPKPVAGVAGPGVPAVCRASNHPFGECAQLETVGHNPRTAFTRRNLQRSADGGLHFPITPFRDHNWRFSGPDIFGHDTGLRLRRNPAVLESQLRNTSDLQTLYRCDILIACCASSWLHSAWVGWPLRSHPWM